MSSPARDFRIKTLSSRPNAQVVERGRGFMRMYDPDADKFILETQVGNIGWHINGTQTEVDTAFEAVAQDGFDQRMVLADYNVHVRNLFNAGNIIRYTDPTSGQWVIFDPQSINWINQDTSREQISIKSAVNGSVSDDVITYTNAYGTGRHFDYQCQTGRLRKRLILDSPLPEPTFLTGTIWFESEFVISNSAGVDLWIDGVQWARGTNRVQTANRIEFRDVATGTQVFWALDFPRAWDSGGNETIGAFELRRQGANYFITVRIPKAWMDAAVYPVYVDPTVDAQVGAGADDGYQTDVGSSPFLTSNSVNLRSTSGGGYSVYMAARCQITGPASGDTVDAAYLTLKINTADIDFNADMQAADDAAALTTATNDISNRTLTGNAVRTTDNGAAFRTINSASMVTSVQAVINRAGWASANYMVTVLQGASATGGQIVTYENSPTAAIIIHIEYTASGGGSSSTGHTLPASAATVASGNWSDNDWDTPANATADDGSNASITAPTFDSPDQSYLLKVYNFDFSSIPAGAEIDGIEVIVNCYYANGTVEMDLLQLLDTSNNPVGTNQCATPVPLTVTSTGVVTKGGVADLWGNTLTDTWVKNSNFGVAIGMLATGANADVFVDYASINVYYTAGGATYNLTATMAVTSALTGKAKNTFLLTATMAVTSALTGKASNIHPLTATMPVTSALTGKAINIHDLLASLAVASALTAKGFNTFGLIGTMPVTSILTAKASNLHPLTSTISVTSSLTGKAINIHDLTAVMPITSSLIVTVSGVTYSLTATLAGTSLLTAKAINIHDLLATLAVASALTAKGFNTFGLIGTMPVTSILTAKASNLHPLTSTISVTSSLTGKAINIHDLTAVMPITSSLIVTVSGVTYSLTATLAGTSLLTAKAVNIHDVTSTLGVTSTLTANGFNTFGMSGTLAVTSTLTGKAVNIHDLTSTLGVTSALTGKASSVEGLGLQYPRVKRSTLGEWEPLEGLVRKRKGRWP